jgi:hypothetical protein
METEEIEAIIQQNNQETLAKLYEKKGLLSALLCQI